jgi:hypothetical protein
LVSELDLESDDDDDAEEDDEEDDELELSDFSDDEDVSLFLFSEFSRARLRVP